MEDHLPTLHILAVRTRRVRTKGMRRIRLRLRRTHTWAIWAIRMCHRRRCGVRRRWRWVGRGDIMGVWLGRRWRRIRVKCCKGRGRFGDCFDGDTTGGGNARAYGGCIQAAEGTLCKGWVEMGGCLIPENWLIACWSAIWVLLIHIFTRLLIISVQNQGMFSIKLGFFRLVVQNQNISLVGVKIYGTFDLKNLEARRNIWKNIYWLTRLPIRSSGLIYKRLNWSDELATNCVLDLPCSRRPVNSNIH